MADTVLVGHPYGTSARDRSCHTTRNCGLSTMSEEELFNFKLLASMTEKMKTTLFVQYARPSLQETLDFIDNQVIVENMSQTPTKMADTVNNIVDDTEKPTNV